MNELLRFAGFGARYESLQGATLHWHPLLLSYNSACSSQFSALVVVASINTISCVKEERDLAVTQKASM